MLNPIEEIKNRLDIVDVIGSYVKLQKIGKNYRALCPFHSEKKPSFFVSRSRQTWHCFGSCGEGGDIFKFVMKAEGVEFGDALRILAQKAGVELKKQDPKFAVLRTERQRLYEICDLSSQFFEKQLEASEKGKDAKKYLLSRKINEESIKKWRIGYAPDVWQALSDFLISKGYKREEIIKSGLAIKKQGYSDSNKQTSKYHIQLYDRFRGRIMFPVFNLNSQIIGFTGRIFGKKQDTAKYVNTPNTLLYDKSNILYGLDKAKIAVRTQNQCILVEGQIDVIMSHQAGIENVVATSGTALTIQQLIILKRYSENLITAFDMDIAGNSATKRGIDTARSQGFNIKVVVMPEDKDPADIISENPEQWKELVNTAKNIYDFYFDTAFLRHKIDTAEGKKEISAMLLPVIKEIPNRIEQSFWLQQLAKRLEVKQEDIEIEMKKLFSVKSDIPAQRIGFDRLKEIRKKSNQEKEMKSRKQVLEERILFLLLKNPDNISMIDQKIIDVFSPYVQKILVNFKKDPEFFKKDDIDEDINSFVNSIDKKDITQKSAARNVKDFLNALCFRAEIEETDVDSKKEIAVCLKQIQFLETEKQLDEMSQDIKKAEQIKDVNKIISITKDFQNLSQKLHSAKDFDSQSDNKK